MLWWLYSIYNTTSHSGSSQCTCYPCHHVTRSGAQYKQKWVLILEYLLYLLWDHACSENLKLRTFFKHPTICFFFSRASFTRCLSDSPPPAFYCFCAVTESSLFTPSRQHVYQLVFSPSSPFCASSQLAEYNSLDFFDEWAVMCCWVWTGSAWRKPRAYLCNRNYDMVLRALTTCHA